MGNTLGERIKETRKSRKITLRDIEKATGVNNGTLSLIENDKTDPKVSTLKVIAEFLNVPIDYLITGKTNINPQFDRRYQLLSQEDKDQIEYLLDRAERRYNQDRKYDKVENL